MTSVRRALLNPRYSGRVTYRGADVTTGAWPVILPADAYARWLDPDNQDVASLQDLLRPYPSEALTAHKVGTLVNNPRHDDPRCLQPAD